MTKIYLKNLGTPTSISKITTKTVKKHDQPYLKFQFDEDLPDKTQVIPSKNKSKITRKTVKKHDGSYLNLKIGANLPNKTQVLPPKNQK